MIVEKYIGIMLYNTINIIMFSVMYYLNSASNKGIYFGVRIPGKYKDEPELKALESRYKKDILLTAGIITIITNYILFKFINSSEEFLEIIISVFMFGVILVFQIPFIIYYKKTKKLKKENGWNIKSNNVVIVDTTLRKPKKNEKIKTVPIKYFVMLLIVPIIMFILTFSAYERLPEVVKVPLSSYEEFNKTTIKGLMTLYSMPVIQLFIGILFIFINKSIMISRVDLSSGSIDNAILRKKKFRKLGSIFLFITSIEMMVMFSIPQVYILYGVEMKLMEYIIIAIIMITMLIFIIYSIKVGQGGRNISNDNEKDELYKDDDSKWILGSFYYNKNDPAMMIEKRVGIGWTINFGNTKAIILSVIFLVIIICFTVLGIVIG